MLELSHVTKRFKKIVAVKDLSFVAQEGRILGLLGENGAGKTTTIRMVAGLLQATSGTITIENQVITKKHHPFKNKIGILFGGDVALYDRLTGYENMMYFARLNGLSLQEAKDSIDHLATRFEMNEYLHRPVKGYSRGMKQKVSIARSIVHNPMIMLFDEPATGLDVMSTLLVHDFIKQCKNEGRTVIFSSHNMYEVEKLAEDVVIIHQGVKYYDGKLTELKDLHGNKPLEEIFIEILGGKGNE